MQLREERRAAKSAAAAAARNTLRKETEWMRRQPKARSVKAAARVRQFYELTAKARFYMNSSAQLTCTCGTLRVLGEDRGATPRGRGPPCDPTPGLGS